MFGNFLSGIILRDENQETTNATAVEAFNYTVCGANFCPNTALPPSSTPDLTKVIKKIFN